MRTTRTVDPRGGSRRRFPAVLLSRLSYANVTATLALFLALGGGAYAAARLPANSVDAPQIKPGAVTRSKVAGDSISTAQLVHNAVTMNRLSHGVRTLLTKAAAPGTTGQQGPAGAPLGASFSATGSDVTAYVNDDPLASLPVSSNGLHILFGSVTLANNGSDPVSGGCGLKNGARQLQAGTGVNLNPGDSATLSLPGLDQIRDSSQPITMICDLNGTGPIAATGPTLRTVRIDG